MRLSPLLRLPEFAIGVAFGRLFVLDRASAARGEDRGRHGCVALVAAGVIIVLLSVGLSLPYPMMNLGLLDPLFGLLIYGVAWQRGALAAIFSLPPVVLLGEASYALYILQAPLWNWALVFTGIPQATAFRMPLYFFGYLAILLALSVLAQRYIEVPARRLIRRVLASGT